MHRLVFLAVLFAVLAPPTMARDNGQWQNVKPEIREWIRGLKNKAGHGCCDEADGFGAEELEWNARSGTYSVVIEGKRHVVPPEAVLTEPNRIGRAMVWYVKDEAGAVIIRCFIAGTMG